MPHVWWNHSSFIYCHPPIAFVHPHNVKTQKGRSRRRKNKKKKRKKNARIGTQILPLSSWIFSMFHGQWS